MNDLKLEMQKHSKTFHFFYFADEINSQDFNVYSKSADVYFNYSEITKLICRAPYLNSKEWHEISKDVVMHGELWILKILPKTPQFSLSYL